MSSKVIAVTAKCAQGHTQTIEVGMNLEFAKQWAALMDGSSAFYIHSPRGTDSVIGKCGICGSQIDCIVHEAAGLEQRVSALEATNLPNIRLGPNAKQDEELERDREEMVKRMIKSDHQRCADRHCNHTRGQHLDGRGYCSYLEEGILCGCKAFQLEAVDRSCRVLTDGSPVTEDYREIDPATGMQKDYVVLCADERAKGFVRPVRRAYLHVGKNPKMSGIVLLMAGENGCGRRTVMNAAIAETYARDPGFYSGTFCVTCGKHRPLDEFVWEGTTEQVGS